MCSWRGMITRHRLGPMTSLAYWISSINSLRKTTLPRDVATVSPTTKPSVLTGPRSADTRRVEFAAEISPATHEIRAAALERFLKHFWIGRGKIGRRQHVQHLPDRELDDRFVLFRHAAHARGGVVPPLLTQEKRLRHQIERWMLPLGPVEASVLRLRLDQRPRSCPVEWTCWTASNNRFASTSASREISICRCGDATRCESHSV